VKDVKKTRTTLLRLIIDYVRILRIRLVRPITG